MISDFKDRKIVIRKLDGYTKYGILVDEDHNFIKIKYRDGNTEIINKRDVKSMEADL